MDSLGDWFKRPVIEGLDDWIKAPATVRLPAALDLIQRTASAIGDGAPTLADVLSISAAAGMLGETAEDVRLYMAGQMLALEEAEQIIETHPELAAKIASMAFQFTAAAASLLRGNIAVRHSGLGKRLAPLAAQSADKAVAVERAKAIAAEMWQADAEQKIRVGEMADNVYRALAAEGFIKSLPGTAERIKEWIKADALEYARKGGKPRKTL